jgi:hypothetical protein
LDDVDVSLQGDGVTMMMMTMVMEVAMDDLCCNFEGCSMLLVEVNVIVTAVDLVDCRPFDLDDVITMLPFYKNHCRKKKKE